MYKIGAFGYTGFTGSELVRTLQNHDGVEIIFRQNSEKISIKKHGEERILKRDLEKAIEDLEITRESIADCDLIICATKEPESMKYVPMAIEQGKKVIDFSGAFRLKNPHDFEKWYGIKHTHPKLLELAVYGLPALYEDKIRKAQLVANPGCYPISIHLLRPLKEFLKHEIMIHATSGISGAGIDVEEISGEETYGALRDHKHVPEIDLYSGFYVVNFVPKRLRSVFRGINADITAKLGKKLKGMPKEVVIEELENNLRLAYKPEDLVFVERDTPDKTWGTRDVNGTPKAIIKIMGIGNDFVEINSLIDNITRPARQAVENINLMLGYTKSYGLENAVR